MTRTGIVNDHLRTPVQQAYQIDTSRVGKFISPERAFTSVTLRDVRTGEASVTFAEDSVAFGEAPTQATSYAESEGWQQPTKRSWPRS